MKRVQLDNSKKNKNNKIKSKNNKKRIINKKIKNNYNKKLIKMKCFKDRKKKENKESLNLIKLILLYCL